jgi:hypothetical protein
MALGDPDRISILMGSEHTGVPGGVFSEVNPGVLLTWEGDAVDWTAGVFRNSYGDWSPAVFASFGLAEWEGGEVAALAGLARYEHMTAYVGVPVAPMVGLHLRHGNAFLNVMPMGKDVPLVISGGVTFELAK